jgi:hypothetical protein
LKVRTPVEVLKFTVSESIPSVICLVTVSLEVIVVILVWFSATETPELGSRLGGVASITTVIEEAEVTAVPPLTDDLALKTYVPSARLESAQL